MQRRLLGYLVCGRAGPWESHRGEGFRLALSFRRAMVRVVLKIRSGLALESVVIQLALALNGPVLRDDHDRAASAAAHLVAGGAQQLAADEVRIAAPEDQQICPMGRGCGG